jgi:hypothetical protein
VGALDFVEARPESEAPAGSRQRLAGLSLDSHDDQPAAK